VQLQGLLLEGAQLVNKGQQEVLVDCSPTAPLTSLLPPLSVVWLPLAVHPDKTLAGNFQTVALPVYLNLSREHYLTSVTLHTESARARILGATAICLSEQ